MAHIVQQLLARTRSHPFAPPPSIVDRAVPPPATGARPTTSAPAHIDAQRLFRNPGVIFPESSRDQQEDLESFADGGMDGNYYGGGGYSPGADDGIQSEDEWGEKVVEPDVAEDQFVDAQDTEFVDAHGEVEPDGVEAESVRVEEQGTANGVEEVDAKIPVHDGEEDVSSQPAVPYVGMIFDDVLDAQKFYNEYARNKGFGTRIAGSKNSQRKGPVTLIKRVFECVHSRKTTDNTKKEITDEGIAEESTSASKQAGVEQGASGTRKRSKLLRHQCKAHMIVGLRKGKWTVTYFVEEHTHPMMEQEEHVRYYRSHRSVPEEDYQMIVALHNRNISTSDVMGLLADEHGGNPRTLPYVKRDVTNIRSKLREGMILKDMALTMEYFQRRQAESPSFFYASLVDKETNSVDALFWVDGRTRALYPKYKDCVFFDTTFCTNRYNMPFAPIVGVNNHLQTVVLGCALLPNEQIETFEWVFNQWLLAMDNVPPDNIMTDQDQAMATAIKNVFKLAVHRCCFWHVKRKAREKMPRLLNNEQFKEAFYACVNNSQSPAEFEETWNAMLLLFNVADHTHLKNMWKSRKTWAPAYFMNNFFPFTTTTGRSEGLNSYFKKLVNPHDSVWTFVRQYELCQETMLDREDNAVFQGITTTAGLWGRYNIEKQAMAFYTRAVFGKFQKMVTASTGYLFNQVQSAEGQGLLFELVSSMNPNARVYRVNVVLEEESYECTCRYFQRNGIICSHIIRSMVQLNVQVIPQRYLMERWSERATISLGGTGFRLDFGLPTTNTLRYNALCRKLIWLASDACFSDATYKLLWDAADHVAPLIAAARRANAQQEDPNAEQSEEKGQEAASPDAPLHGDGQTMLQNPVRQKKKGRPSEKSKRKKPLLEEREEKHAKKQKKKKAKIDASTGDPITEEKPSKGSKCSCCKEPGHNVTTCEVKKLAKELAAKNLSLDLAKAHVAGEGSHA